MRRCIRQAVMSDIEGKQIEIHGETYTYSFLVWINSIRLHMSLKECNNSNFNVICSL